MGIENIREIEFRYIVQYKGSSVVETFYRTLEQIEKGKDFPSAPHQVIAKNQYTNVKDVVNEKLYEGDVAGIKLPPRYAEEIIGQIVWKDGGFVIESFINGSIAYRLKLGKVRKLGDVYHNRVTEKKEA